MKVNRSMHPLARKELSAIPLPKPVSDYRPGLTERLYTNPFAGEYRDYPCPLPYPLYQAYADILNAENMRNQFMENIISNLSAEHIMFTAGSIMGIDLIIRAFCEPNKDSICINTPTFNGYKQYANVNLVDVIDVPLQGEYFDKIDTETILSHSVKIIFLCVPSNPIGSCISKQEILSILKQAQGLVVIDEAYIDLADMPSSTALVKEYPNLVVLRTFSKGWGLAGIRAGAVIAGPEIIAVLGRIQDPFSVSTPVQQAIKNAFSNVQAYRQGILNIKAARALIINKLQNFSFIDKIYPSNTNFVLAKLIKSTHLLNEIKNSRCLLDHGPAEVPFSIKISVGNTLEQTELFNFLERFEEVAC